MKVSMENFLKKIECQTFGNVLFWDYKNKTTGNLQGPFMQTEHRKLLENNQTPENKDLTLCFLSVPKSCAAS